MEQKFKKGDVVKIRTSGETVMVIEYRVNNTGGVLNALTRRKQYEENVITDEILCEGTINGKYQKKYINEANLELTS